jgi:predicted dienelactone hydrolase
MLKKILAGFAGLVALLIVGLAVVYLATGPESPASDSLSAAALESGPYSVSDVQITLVDESRATGENGDFPGAESRTLVTSIWYPEGDPADRYPLVIYSHGFMSSRDDGNYLARALASHGYVVASADFPLTNMAAPGGPNASDVGNQPGDVTFLIDSLIGLEGDAKPFAGEIDPARIGVMGLSLGGLTSTLVTYHPRWGDKRIKAAVSIAGPAVMFSRRFFLNSSAPLLMIGGTADAIVDFEANAAIIPNLALQGTLLTIEDASHTGFVSLAEPAMRFFDHPDSLGCDALTSNLAEAPEENPFSHLGGLGDGVNPDKRGPPLCSQPLIKSLHPGRQQMITQVGVLSFFQSVLAAERDERRSARQLLIEGIPEDFPEASITL